jgi:hypothetical protein
MRSTKIDKSFSQLMKQVGFTQSVSDLEEFALLLVFVRGTGIVGAVGCTVARHFEWVV